MTTPSRTSAHPGVAALGLDGRHRVAGGFQPFARVMEFARNRLGLAVLGQGVLQVTAGIEQQPLDEIARQTADVPERSSTCENRLQFSDFPLKFARETGSRRDLRRFDRSFASACFNASMPTRRLACTSTTGTPNCRLRRAHVDRDASGAGDVDHVQAPRRSAGPARAPGSPGTDCAPGCWRRRSTARRRRGRRRPARGPAARRRPPSRRANAAPGCTCRANRPVRNSCRSSCSLADFLFDRHAGIVAHSLPHAGQRGEQRGLAGVRIADQGNRERGPFGHRRGHIHRNISGARATDRRQNQSGSICTRAASATAHAKTIAAQFQLQGIAERRCAHQLQLPRPA